MKGNFEKILRITLAVLFIVWFGLDNLFFVQAVSRGNDQLTLNTPVEGAIIKGTVDVNWFMRDTEQTQIPYQIDLYNNACQNYGKYYGTVADSNPPQNGNNQNFDYSWNTLGAIKNKANVPDNPYCLRVCGIMVHDAKNYYTLCEIHTIVVANFNQAPKINSTPTGLNLKVGDTFSYALKATDADGDALTYQFIQSPAFLTISPAGLISTSGPITAAGSYDVSVKVTDTKGSYDQQAFTLNVSAAQTVQLQFSSPILGTTITDQHVIVKWTNSQPTNIKTSTLSYSADGTTFIKIADLKPTDTQYSWDISGLANGNYRLKLDVTYNNGDQATQTSPEFSVAYAPNNSQSAPLITSLNPADGSKTANRRPTIGAKYASSDVAKINLDKLDIKLDDVALTGCTKATDQVSCVPTSDLAIGQHKVTLTVEDSAGKQDTKEWTFEISDQTSITPTVIATIAPSITAAFNLPGSLGGQLPLILLIICLGGLLLLIPWVLFTLWQRGKQKTMIKPTKVNTSQSYPTAPLNPDVLVNSYTYPAADVNQQYNAIPVDNQTYAPAPETYAAPAATAYEPTIGEQSLGGDYSNPNLNVNYGVPAYDPNTVYSEPPVAAPQAIPAVSTSAIDQNQVTQENAPSMYNNTEQIPDWLKETGVNGNNGSVAVDASGQNSNQLTYNISDDQAAQPHDDFDIGNRT